MEMITYLKRRFSSGDLQGEAADKREHEGLPGFLRFGNTAQTPAAPANPSHQPSSVHSQQYPQRWQDSHVGNLQQQRGAEPMLTGQYASDSSHTSTVEAKKEARVMFRGKHDQYPSAPASPSRGHGMSASFMGPVSNITGQISNTIMGGFSHITSNPSGPTTSKTSTNKERQKVLLVIDDSQTDWTKYFRGRRILGDWDVRVEQAEFSQIGMTAYGDLGCVINTYQGTDRGKPYRSFKPDFVLIRQHVRETNEDWQPILTGLMYAGTPCLNTLHAVYNMKNRPWMFAHLLLLRKRLGKEIFPLISQVYYTSYKEMITAPAFPTIIKVGHGHGGEGKIRVDNPISYQDVTSLLIAGKMYATTEPFIDAMCDVHVQKIGSKYRVFVRKSISGHWKTNAGSAILEKVPLSDMFRQWVDEVSRMFGGLDICSVEALQSKNGEYFIYEVNGSDMVLFGDSQEEDRREIAELVLQRMQTACLQGTVTQMNKQPVESVRSSAGSVAPVSVHSQMPSIDRISPNYTATNQSPVMRPPRQSMQPSPPQQYPIPPTQYQPHSSYSSQQSSYVQPLNAPASSHPQYSPHPAQPPLNQASLSSSASLKQQSLQQVSTYEEPPYDPGTSLPTSPGEKWDGQTPVSSIRSSVDSVAATKGNFGIPKQEGFLPSGYNTSTASTAGEPRITTTQSKFGNSFPTRQSPFSQTNASDSCGPAWNQSGYAGSSIGSFDGESGSHMEKYGRGTGHSLETNGYFDRPNDEVVTGANESGLAQSSGTNLLQGQATQTSRAGNPGITALSGQSNAPPKQASLHSGEDTDDTMKNLRKTFAGIFGDM
ncbi:unnamed protein product [Dicrocoelium dendriticum]|nr:unnamed protein product [Dicrocoelium dendriticum]